MISTNRLTIDHYKKQDEEAMVKLLMNSKIRKSYVIPEFKSSEEAKTYFYKLMDYSNSPNHYEYGIYYQNQLIGFVNDVDCHDKTIEIGYVIHPDYHNLGLATEMLNAVIDDLFHRGYQTILSCAFEFNLPSFRVMEKCGMKKIDRQFTMIHDQREQTCLYYAIHAQDFPRK